MPKLKINSKKRLERKFMRISDLKFADYNPRSITDKARKGLAASIHEFGLVQEIVVNRRNMQVVGGHQRLNVLREQGEEDVPVVLVDLDPEKEKALNVALNNPGISGEFDPEKLELVLNDLGDELKIDFLLNDLIYHKIDYNKLKGDIWKEMPDFENEDGHGIRITVHFEDENDLKKFSGLIGQKLTPQTKSIWFPEKEKLNQIDYKVVDEP